MMTLANVIARTDDRLTDSHPQPNPKGKIMRLELTHYGGEFSAEWTYGLESGFASGKYTVDDTESGPAVHLAVSESRGSELPSFVREEIELELEAREARTRKPT